MSAKIIVSYDGTANEDDAIALGRIFARAGAEASVAYVRHAKEPDYSGETLAQNEAQELVERGAALLGVLGLVVDARDVSIRPVQRQVVARIVGGVLQSLGQ